MRSIELRPRNPVEQETDRLTGGIVSFVLANLPDRRFLLKQIRENLPPLSFKIGDQKWQLNIQTETSYPDSQPVHIVTLDTLSQKTKEDFVVGIITDFDLKKINGVYKKVGKSQKGYSIPEIDFKEEVIALREKERRQVLRSLSQTHSIRRTSQLRGLSDRQIKTHIYWGRRRGYPIKLTKHSRVS